MRLGGFGDAQVYVQAVLLLVLIPAVWLAATYFGERAEYRAARDAAQGDARLYGLAISGLLKQHEQIPNVAALCPCIEALLGDPGDPEKVDAVNRHLDAIAKAVAADTLYLLDRDGVALASSDWRSSSSVIARRYGHRNYFQQATQNGESRQITAGGSAAELGFYVGKRVHFPSAGLAGVIVLRDSLDSVSDYLARSSRVGGEAVLALTDSHDIVVAASALTWVLRPLLPIDDKVRGEIVRYYPRAVLNRLPVIDAPVTIGADNRETLVKLFDPYEGRYRVYRFPLRNLGLNVDIFAPVVGWQGTVMQYRIAGLALLVAGFLVWFWLARRRRRRGLAATT